MTLPDSADQRHALAERLRQRGHLADQAWRAAVQAVPREAFLHGGVFLPQGRQRRPRPVAGGDA